MRKTPLLLLTLLIITPLILAEPTQQYNQIYLDPYYIASFASGTTQNFNVTVNPPDGISKVINAVVKFHAYILPTVTYTLTVNNRTCNTATYTVSTTQASAGMADVSFDCSNIINTAGKYTIKLSANKNTGATTSWLELTYMNQPPADLTLHGTEYTYGQTSKAWLQLLNKSNPVQTIERGICFVDIYNPDNTQFIERAVMNNQQHDGIYYYNVVLPEIEGVYPVIAKCYYEATEVPQYATSITMINGSITSGTITDTKLIDSIDLNTDETPAGAGNPRRYQSIVTFTNQTVCENTSELLLNGIGIKWTGRWNSNVAQDNMTLSIYNHTSATYQPLPNKITGSGVGVKSISNSIELNNLTKAGYANASGSDVRIKFQDTDAADSATTGFDYDQIIITCETYASPAWQQVAGSSEFHLSAPINFSSLNYTTELQNIYNQTTQIVMLINNQTTTITDQLTNLTNTTQTNQNWLIQIWNYLTGYLNTTINNIQNNLFEINQTINNLTTPTNYTGIPITIITNTSNCITTSNWQITALVLNQYNQPMTNTQTTCNITTTLWNETPMNYTSPYFTYQNTCPTPTDWNWTIQCI